MKIETFEFNGYTATLHIPENANGKWIWKAEFFDAFDKAERELLEEGYTRVYYQIRDMYGSFRAVRLMHEFYKEVTKRYNLDKKCTIFGFSRGGLYTFNYTLFYPETVNGVYLDAPVLDLKTWPRVGIKEHDEMLNEYWLNDETLKTFKGNPIDNLEEFFSHKIPLFLVAGGSDQVVPFEQNSGVLVEYCKKNGINIGFVFKPECLHHPHSLDDVTPIKEFVRNL